MSNDTPLPPRPDPWDYAYEWGGPFGTRKLSAASWNGRPPDRCVPIYTGEQLDAYAAQAVAEALASTPKVARAEPVAPAVAKVMGGWFLPLTALNDLMRGGFERLLAHAKRARWTNAIVRKDSVETSYEADWIKYMVPLQVAIRAAAPVREPLTEPEAEKLWRDWCNDSNRHTVIELIRMVERMHQIGTAGGERT